MEPKTCPPLDYLSFNPRWLEGRDFIYFDLHGLPNTDFWFEMTTIDGVPMQIKAITANLVRSARLDGAVVFATNCHLADENSQMLDALLDAGAKYVIAGEGKNWASTRRPTGAAELGRLVRVGMERGGSPLNALGSAKHALKQQRNINLNELKDTLEFKAYYRMQQ